MKILTIHADFIEIHAKKRAFKAAEEIDTKDQRVEECLVVFSAVEKNDEKNVDLILEKYVAEVKKIAGMVNSKKIVLYPYAHLSSDLASPSIAVHMLKDAQAKLLGMEDGFEVVRAPFGWYKAFNVSCKGHPLSELSRNITSEEKFDLKKEGKDELFVFDDLELSHEKKHSFTAAMLVAKAVKKMYPESKIGGVSFYQDRAVVDFDNLKVKESQLNKIQREAMSQKGNFSFSKVDVDDIGGSQGLNDLQKNIAKDISAKEVIDFGSFKLVSLFNDPVLEAKVISNLKIYNLSSAYWKNNSNNNQLIRFTVKGFSSSDEFDLYEKNLREAQDRSHIKLGKELGLFVISDLVGAGLPLLTAKGNIIRREIIDFLWKLHNGTNHQWVWTPHIAKSALYKTSGHWDKFGDELFKVSGKGDEQFVMKPMNCPHHMQIFDSMNLSYRDMPVRMFEPATIYRDEKSGQLHGLSRVRAITQDDGHLFCRVGQIKQEVAMIVDVVRRFYETIGMDDYWVSLSVRGEDKSKYLGSDEVWNIAQSALDEAAKENKLNYKRVEGEAAFYGPKLDFMFKDALGREWQLATIQCDFNLPERFNLSFMNEKGEKERPVVIHRAISGSLERFMSVLIEHFAGKFPLWLSPVQVKILTVNDTHAKLAYEVATKLRSHGLRVEVDDRVESIGKKAREARLARVNYVLTVGDKEVAGNSLAVMKRGSSGPEFGVAIDAFVTQIVKERDDRVI